MKNFRKKMKNFRKKLKILEFLFLIKTLEKSIEEKTN